MHAPPGPLEKHHIERMNRAISCMAFGQREGGQGTGPKHHFRLGNRDGLTHTLPTGRTAQRGWMPLAIPVFHHI